MKAAFLDELIKTLKDRFAKNMHRHAGIDWNSVQAKLEASPAGKIQALHEMEHTGGEPDVIACDANTGEFIFVIVRLKVLQVDAAFVMTARRSIRAKKTSRVETLSRWRLR